MLLRRSPFITCALCAALSSILPAGAVSAAGLLEDYDRDAYSVVDRGRRLNVELVKPPEYQRAARALPLTVFLHGSTDGRSTKRARLNETLFFLLHATQGENWERQVKCRLMNCSADEIQRGQQLAAQQDQTFSSFVMVPQIPESSSATGWSGNFDLVLELVQQTLTQYNIDANRIYLTGFSDGGFATYSLLNLHPDYFAAAAPIAGGGSPSIAPRIKDVPIWIFHGAADGVVGPSRATQMFDALTAAGGSPRLTMYPGVGHDSFAPALLDAGDEFYPWLFSQSQVPEPGAGTLLVGGVLLAVARGRVHGAALMQLIADSKAFRQPR